VFDVFLLMFDVFLLSLDDFPHAVLCSAVLCMILKLEARDHVMKERVALSEWRGGSACSLASRTVR
jgi:hypothetical protein